MKILILCSALIAFGCAKAQIRVGLEAGIGMSKWVPTSQSNNYNEDEYRTRALPGLEGGVVVNLRVSEKARLQAGIILNERGSKLANTNWHDTSSQNIWVDYITLPISLMYKLYGRGHLAFQVGGGLYVAHCLYGVQEGEGTSLSGPYNILNRVVIDNQNENQILPMIVKPLDYGYTLNLSAEWKEFQFLLRYSHGLYNILPNSRLFHGNYRNTTLSFSVMYFIIH